MIQEDWDREAASYPQRCTSETWLGDTSPSNEPPKADLESCFERGGASGFQIGPRNSLRTAMANNENSIHNNMQLQPQNLQTRRQSDGSYPPATNGPTKIFLIQQDQV